MDEINNIEHGQLMYYSWNKAILNYKYSGVLDFKDLKMLDIVYRILNESCFKLTNTEKYELLKEYFRIIRENPIICNAQSHVKLFTGKSHFQQSYQEQGTATKSKIVYFQDTSFGSIQSLLDKLNRDDLPVNTQTVLVDDTLNGHYFKSTTAGRFAMILDNPKYTDLTITDVLNNNVTKHFKMELSKNGKNILIVSNNIYSMGDIYLKFKIN